MNSVNEGSCNCGSVRFRTHGELRGVIYCHCVQCRKQSGHYFAATSVAESALELEGADSITWYAASDEARRGFCRVCGSALFWKRHGAETISILAGSFDTNPGFSPLRHIFTAEKGDYYTIDDGLPQVPNSRSLG